MSNFYNKIITDEDKQIMRRYLSLEYQVGGYIIKSTYFAAIKNARSLAGRDGNGFVINEGATGSWSGACMYFILIDHIAGMFSINNYYVGDGNRDNYIKCLREVGELDEDEASTLYALRNAFIHKFNLYSIDKSNKYKHYLFSVNRDQDCLIQEAKEAWTGRIFDNQPSMTTMVSLRVLGDLVEGMHLKLLEFLEKGDLYVMNPKDYELEKIFEINSVSYLA